MSSSGSSADAAPDAQLSWRLVRADGRPPDVVAFEEEVLAFFVGAADLLGVPKSVALVYGIFFSNADPLSYSDIRDRLDISAGSISSALRVLSDIGALKPATADDFSRIPEMFFRKGSNRANYYVPDMELRKVLAHFLKHRLQKQLDAGHERLLEIKAALPTADAATTKKLKGRLEHLKSWHDKTRSLLPVIRSVLTLA